MMEIEQRIAIAQFCGILKDPPDYLNDLDAMRNAEALLPTPELMHNYAITLLELVCKKQKWPVEVKWWTLFGVIHASAEIRAMAFLKVIRKWK